MSRVGVHTRLSDGRVSASEFKKVCLSLLDNLGSEGVVITKRGKPVAKLVPLDLGPPQVRKPVRRVRKPREGPCAALIGSMKGKLKPKGNLFSTGLRWDAES